MHNLYSDGLPIQSVDATRNGSVIFDDNASFEFTVQATEQPKQLILFIGGWKSEGKLEIFDKSADTEVQTFTFSDPEKSYHFEIVCASMGKAQQIQKIMRCFALDAKIVSRKKSFVVYLKEGAQIVDVLNVMEAHQSLMELENIRILKDMRNTVNRKVNCETANINKTVSAAVKQIDDIRYIEETKGLDKLPEGLKDMALTRLTYPEASLKELGALLQNPVGKSGVNHRLRKLSEMAEEIRAKQGGTL